MEMEPTKRAPEGGVYKQEATFCHKEGCKKCERGEGHGPYWYRYWWEGGKTRKKYVGKDLQAHLDKLPKELTEELTEEPQGAAEEKLDPQVRKALMVIRDHHAREVEPTVKEVAQAAGATTRGLGPKMSKLGLQAEKCHRRGVQARRYTFKLKEAVAEALK
jgi:TRAP-type mannitol/chloroaromatic compound transport system substrate-binding protein